MLATRRTLTTQAHRRQMMVHRFDRTLARAVCTALAVCFLSILCTRPAPDRQDPRHPDLAWSVPDDSPLDFAAPGSRPRDPLPETPRDLRVAASSTVVVRVAERPHAPRPTAAAVPRWLPRRGGPRVPSSDDDPPSALDDDRVTA